MPLTLKDGKPRWAQIRKHTKFAWPKCAVQKKETFKEMPHGMVTEEPQDGMVTEEPQDGMVTEEPQDGEVTKEPQNGKVTKKKQNGKVTKKKQNANVTKKKQNGKVTKKKQNANVTKEPQDGEVTKEPQDGEESMDLDLDLDLHIGDTVAVAYEPDDGWFIGEVKTVDDTTVNIRFMVAKDGLFRKDSSKPVPVDRAFIFAIADVVPMSFNSRQHVVVNYGDICIMYKTYCRKYF
ncbi:uncharacterized protein LOC118415246 [Branchiostoma floridae]|nr:uncharacterized protein LOC118415246 [Branchiostoma floridae]